MPIWLGIDIGIRNLSYCVVRSDEGKEFCIEIWQNVDLLQDTPFASLKKVSSASVHALAYALLPTIFPPQHIRQTVGHVCIEQQPAGKYGNPKLVLMQHLVYDYFMRLARVDSTLLGVTFTSAGRKYNTSWLTEFEECRQSDYGKRKKLSVRLALGLIRTRAVTNASGHVFPGNSKADDFADSFLLAFQAADDAKHLMYVLGSVN